MRIFMLNDMSHCVKMGITLNHDGLFTGPALDIPFYLAYYSLSNP
ncbi:hypothetical protein [Thermoplasma sp. Kam2015]|nr:hypothetical protein [Thermoplasma sp. Kam2015]